MPETVLKKPKATRLPVPKVFTDTARYYHENTDQVCVQESPITPDSEQGKYTDKDRDAYWRRIRVKREEKSRSPPKSKDKHKHPHCATCRRIIALNGSPKSDDSKDKTKHAGKPVRDDKILVRGANPRTGIISPSVSPPNSSANSSPEKHSRHCDNHKKWRMKADQWVSLDVDQLTPPKSSAKANTATDTTVPSQELISPVSGTDSSTTDWEDRFVVNMPSAREPNPPTMTSQQIIDFQRSIEKVYSDGGTMLDPDTLPSPRTMTPEDKFPPIRQAEKTSSGRKSQEPKSIPLVEADQQPSVSPTRGPGKYYSPDEVGRKRFGAVWVESPLKSKGKVQGVNLDGSFLGCKDVNQPEVKNPDEILLFPNMDDCPNPSNASAPASKTKPREESKSKTLHTTAPTDEKAVLQEEWKPISQNLKLAQCSRQSPRIMCQQDKPKKQYPKTPGKENSCPDVSPLNSSEKKKENRRGEDVFIITPTTTRTMINTMINTGIGKETKDPVKQHQFRQQSSHPTGGAMFKIRVKPPKISTQFGCRPTMSNLPERSNIPSMMSSQAASVPGIPVAKNRVDTRRVNPENGHTTHGLIHTSGADTSPTEKFVASRHEKLQPYVSDVTSVDQSPLSKAAPESSMTSRYQHMPSHELPAKDTPRSDTEMRPGKVTEVAELDGHQISRHRESFCSNIPNFALGLSRAEMQDDLKGGINVQTLSLLFDILLLSAAQFQALFRGCKPNHHGKAAFGKILEMAEHCLHVFKRLLIVISIYKSTGSWPKPSNDDLGRFLTELVQAIVYFAILGFMMMVVGRAAGYVIYLGSWIVWFARPFGWTFSKIGQVLLA